MCACLFMCVHMCVDVHVSISMFVHTHTHHTHTHTHTQVHCIHGAMSLYYIRMLNNEECTHRHTHKYTVYMGQCASI